MSNPPTGAAPSGGPTAGPVASDSPTPPPTPGRRDIVRFCLGLIALGAVVVSGLLLVSAVVLPPALGWQAVAVSSGSMEPAIGVGDVVLAAPYRDGELRPGAVLLFDDPIEPGLLAHRLVSVNRDGTLITRGDANRTADSTPVAPDSVVGIGRLVVPAVGRLSLWASSGNPWNTLLIVAASALVLWTSRWGALGRFDPWGDAARAMAFEVDPEPVADPTTHRPTGLLGGFVALPALGGAVPVTSGLIVVAAVVALAFMVSGRRPAITTGRTAGGPSTRRVVREDGRSGVTRWRVRRTVALGSLPTAGLLLAALNLPTANATVSTVTLNDSNSFTASEWVRVIGLTAGTSHACLLRDLGSTWCWGRNDKGQLGDNTTTDRPAPVQVVLGGGTFDDAIDVAAGSEHTCAVRSDGGVWCWGRNDKGQLGDNTTTDRPAPVQVTGPGGTGTLLGATAITAGLKHTCAVTTDNTVWCWGLNDKGQLGDNTTTNRTTPAQVTGAGGTGTLTNATTVAADLQHTCATKTDGSAWCWGLNDKGQLGDNTTTDRTTPVQVKGPGGTGTLTNVSTLAAGSKHTCATTTDNTAWCWGLNNKGQLGDNTTTNRTTPVQVTGTLTNTSSIAAGLQHTCSTRTDGSAWCWGLNNKGQLGDNTTTDRPAPVQVKGPGGTGTLTNAARVTAGEASTCALKTDGTVWCWGLNDKGQLGDNTTTNRTTPVQVTGPGGTGTLTDVTTVDAGLQHACAVRADATVWCWGVNNKGQLGDGSTVDRTTPTQVI